MVAVMSRRPAPAPRKPPPPPGFKAVELAYKAFKGETVADVDTGAKFYDKSNMDQKDIAILLCD